MLMTSAKIVSFVVYTSRREQGSPTPRVQTSPSPRPVRSRAAQQAVMAGERAKRLHPCLRPRPSASIAASAPPRVVRHEALTAAPVPAARRLGTAALGDTETPNGARLLRERLPESQGLTPGLLPTPRVGPQQSCLGYVRILSLGHGRRS